LAWATLASGDGDGAMPLRGIDITAAQLRLLGANFADTRLLVAPAGEGTQVRFDGAALAGTLQLPRETGAAVSGRFARLHWQSVTPLSGAATPAANPPPTAQAAERDQVDPSKVPPLRLDVDDFRFGTLALGQLELRTRATADGL